MKKALKSICLAVLVMAIGDAFGQVNEENGLNPVNKYGYQDASGKMVIPFLYDDANSFSEGLAAVLIDGKWGFIDENGKMVIEPQYEEAGKFSSGLANVMVGNWSDGKWGYIDKTGKVVIQAQFDLAYPFSGDVATVRIGDYSNGKWGCIDKAGKVVIQPKYDGPVEFRSGILALAEVDEKKTLINNKGKTVVEIPADTDFGVSGDFENGWGYISVNNMYGLADENGWVKEPQFDHVTIIGAMAWVTKNGLHGVLKKNGQWFIEPKENITKAWGDYKDIICVSDEDKYGYINGNGWLVSPQYAIAEQFSEGLAAVCVGDDSYGCKLGYIDETGKMVIEPKLNYSWDPKFYDGLALVGDDNGKIGFIDKKGNWVIQPLYDDARPFSEGFARVEIEDRIGYIDKTGKMVVNPQYEVAGNFSNGLAAVKVDEKWGYIDKTGKMVIQPKFDDADEFNASGKAYVRIGDWDNGTRGYVDRNGNFTPDKD